MWFNYFKVAVRSLLRRRLYTAINIFGLSVAMGCAVVGYLNYRFNTTWDSFHSNADRIYRLGSSRLINGHAVRYGIVPSQAAEILRNRIPGIDGVVEFESSSGIARIGDHLFTERLYFSTESLFEIFSFEALAGNPVAAVSSPGQVIVSEEYAVKYFGEIGAVGKTVSLRIGNGEMHEYTVGAVMKALPKTSSIKFNILMNLRILETENIRLVNDWKDWVGSIFFLSPDPDIAQAVTKTLQSAVAVQNSAVPTFKISGFFVTPLLDVAYESRDIRSNILANNPPFSSFVGTLSMAGIILLLACFNYVNTSLAYSAVRLKEVGIRKVVGGRRSQIIRQFLGEQIILCAVALLAGLGIAELMVKGWNYLWDWNQLSLQYSDNIPLLGFLVVLIVGIAVVAGFYPAFYVSRFHPVQILRGRLLHMRINHFMRGMLVLQFALSLIAIVQAVAFTQNARFMESMDLGYARDNRVMIPIGDDKLYEPLRDALMTNSAIKNVSGGRDHVFFGWRRRTVSMGEKNIEADVLRVESGYPALMNFRLKRGRLFDRELTADKASSIVVTEGLVQAMDLGEGLGATLEVDESRYKVVGVVEDFLNRGVWDPAGPVLFRCVDGNFNFVLVEMASDPGGSTFTLIKDTWNRLNPDQPFAGEYQDLVVAEAIRVSKNITLMNLVMGTLAFTMATLGLFSLVSLKTVRRTKEIGIRKVLGATTSSIVGLMNREFVLLIVIAIVVGNSIGYFLTTMLLDAIYTYHVDVGLEAMVLASLSSLAIAFLTGGWVVWKAAHANPVDSLRYE